MNSGTIYVLAPENDRPSGGIKILYRHVDVLQSSGFPAAILHQQPGFRCTWFENDTRVVYLPDVQLTDRDVLVIPEVFGSKMLSIGNALRIGSRVRKVIFNQNCYYTFLGYSVDSVLHADFRTPYTRSDEFVAAIVVSEDSRRYLEYAFRGLKVFRIHNAINADLFYFQADKKKQICFMPRKHPEDALQVLAILQARGTLGGFSVVAIHDKSEKEVADIMRESLIFLSFGYPEGFSLPPAEAMACGCVVVGYHGQGGEEYFKPEFCHPVEINDIVGYANAVEGLIEDWGRDPARLVDKGMRAAQFVAAIYSSEQERRDIVALWRALFSDGVNGSSPL